MDKIICIAGPTASGKTALAVELAKELSGEVVSCDSMYVYKGMDIGTAMNLMNQLLGCVRTDMTDAEITRYALELFPLLSGNLTQPRIPIEGSYEDNHNVIIPDYDMNHQFLVDTLMPD